MSDVDMDMDMDWIEPEEMPPYVVQTLESADRMAEQFRKLGWTVVVEPAVDLSSVYGWSGWTVRVVSV